jgi:hypothetical protein
MESMKSTKESLGASRTQMQQVKRLVFIRQDWRPTEFRRSGKGQEGC